MNLTYLIEKSEQIFQFGSRVYGTERIDSDFDYIVVLKENEIKTCSEFSHYEHHYQIYSFSEFISKIQNHDIQALECLFLSDKFKLKHSKIDFGNYFELDLNKLRETISTIVNNSWTKCKKKLIIPNDYDKLSAIKSCFHAFRILNFGCQIARDGFIRYSEMNYILIELNKLAEQYDSEILWDKINSKYKSLLNNHMSEFRILAPKDMTNRSKENELKKLLKDENVYSEELQRKILEIFS